MRAETRRSTIIDLLERERTVSVDELSTRFAVSEVTIRKDLKQLEERGFLQRVHGGAVFAPRVLYNPSFKEKEHLRSDAKRAIAQRALEEVHEGESIILDAGSTTLALARAIRRHREHLVVITNSIPVALELAGTSLDVLLLGGHLRHHSLAMIGPATVETLRSYHADTAFMGATGVDVEHGFTTPNALEAETKAAMVRSSTRVVVLADASKLSRVTLAKFADLDRAAQLITDAAAPAEFLETAGRSLRCEVAPVAADASVAEASDAPAWDERIHREVQALGHPPSATDS
ncbi:MAG TPA: DeoR/GlpR family DNA-binding transcription regulator [Trueperaceae bacterium]|nr:DeoR/GlpR family DNA-binding transcription regulator [Trueperaceae bacterium]